MDRVRLLLVLASAMIAGFLTVRFATDWLDSQEASIQAERDRLAALLAEERARLADGAATEAPATPAVVPEPARVFVLVANRPLAAGTFVGPDDLRWQAWPEETLAPSYILRDGEMAGDYAGAVVRTRMGEGEPVTAARIVRPGTRGYLAAVLNPGMRAISVPVSATTSVSGLVFPGDRVDIILNHRIVDAPGSFREFVRISETVFEDIRVLAIDQNTDDTSAEPVIGNTATLELAPKQVEMIQVVLQLGTLSLSLRSVADPMADDTREAEIMPARLAVGGGAGERPLDVGDTEWDGVSGLGFRVPANEAAVVRVRRGVVPATQGRLDVDQTPDDGREPTGSVTLDTDVSVALDALVEAQRARARQPEPVAPTVFRGNRGE